MKRKTDGRFPVAVAAALTVALTSAAPGRGLQTGQAKAKQDAAPVILANYRSWKCLTSMRRYYSYVGSPGLGLCRPLTRPEYQKWMEEAGQESDAHTAYFLNVYVNKTGAKAFQEGAKAIYPTGTAIIKEKYLAPDGGEPVLMTVMIKRQPGYDPKNGDWQYLVLSGDGQKILPGTQQHCQDCHRKVRATGYVFRPYAP